MKDLNSVSTDNSMPTRLVVESAVLLKNEGGALPLLKPSAAAKAAGRSGVAIFGLAKEKNAIFGGTGSGSVVPSHAVSPWAGITAPDSPARKNGFGSFSDHTEDSIADAVRAAHDCCDLADLGLNSLLEGSLVRAAGPKSSLC